MIDAHAHNRAIFDDERVATSYERLKADATFFLDAGEQAALVAVAPHCRGTAILDVGVGAGRTTALLRLISDRYKAVDYSARMVEAFRHNYPNIECTVGDARDLAGEPDHHYGLIMFSNNALDGLDRDDRVKALSEFRRVATTDGFIVFSTLNKNGPSFGEHPFQLHRPHRGVSARQLAIRLARSILDPYGVVKAVRNYRVHRHLVVDHGSWAIGPLAAHYYAPICYFTSIPDLAETVERAKLTVELIFDDSGAEVDPLSATSVSEHSKADYFTVVARPA